MVRLGRIGALPRKFPRHLWAFRVTAYVDRAARLVLFFACELVGDRILGWSVGWLAGWVGESNAKVTYITFIGGP